jgi:lysophospholipid acyltransferase (LPLAT)-like uncharacterized protein
LTLVQDSLPDPLPLQAAPRKSSRAAPHKPLWFQRVGAHFVFLLESALTASLRFDWHDDAEFLRARSGPVIFCIWHNRLALSMAAYRRYARREQPECRMAALVSASKDGAFLASVLERFGVQPVRGSTSRRGPQALLELTGWAERGYDLAITPDGPRGPRYVVKEGVIALAQLTGLPIVPVSCNLRRKASMKSWDKFQIPLPFSSCEVFFCKPFLVPRELSEPQRESLRSELQRMLLEKSVD